MSKSLREVTDVLRQIIEGKIKQASIGDNEDDKTQPAEIGEHGEELIQENKDTIPSGVESHDEEEEKDTDEDKELETIEGAENLLAGPAGFEGVPEPSDTPTDSPTSSPASVEKQSHIKQASTNELSDAAIFYASSIAEFVKEASEDGGYLLSEISPRILSRIVADKVVEDARSRANMVGAILYSVKLAQDASVEEEEAEEEEPEAEEEERRSKEDEIESEIPTSPEEEQPAISNEDIDKLLDAIVDLARSEPIEQGSPETLEEEEEPTEEGQEEEETPEESPEDKGEIMERLLAGSPAPAQEAAPPEEIKNASDEEILSATLDALLARGESLTDLASKGGRTGYRLAKSAEVHLKSGKYVPLSRLPAEKRARAKRLRDHVEDFIADLYNKSRN